MAFHRLVRPAAAGICLLLATAAAAERKPDAVLTVPEQRDGWVQLFDGGSTFGLETTGDVAVKDGKLVIGGPKGGSVTTAARFSRYGEAVLEYTLAGPSFSVRWQDGVLTSTAGTRLTVPQAVGRAAKLVPVTIEAPPGTTVSVSRFVLVPKGQTPLFNGKDLSGWKPFTGDAKREKSKFAVTPDGELSVKDGPGDLQTEASFADFLLQLECKTNGKGLNSGVFFRCLPGQYQQGYEAQIQNLFNGDDRTKPTDFGTGAVYRRVPARYVVSNDNEWFTLSVLAVGPTVHTWVNGYPTVSWTDDRKPAENARQGLYTKAGPISLQGHDPTTDLLFRNIRAAGVK